MKRTFGILALALTSTLACFSPILAGINGVSSLGASAPTTDLGKNASPGLSEDQVSATGAFSYRYSLTFPKGRLGVTPEISLSYSSDGALRGGVAAGWTLAVPMIKGDVSLGSLDDKGVNPSVERYTSSFRGGGALVRDSDAPIDGQRSHVYLALHDNAYVRYEKLLPAPDQPVDVLWRVRTSDGMVYEFGDRSQHTYDRAPLLRQIDAYGNVLLEYHWSRHSYPLTSDTEATEWALDRVDYLSPGGEVYARVELEHVRTHCPNERLPQGALVDFHSGEAYMSGSRKLKEIRVKALRPEGESMELSTELRDVRRYQLVYSDQTSQCEFNLGAPLRRLDGILETAYAPGTQAAMTLPQTLFEYGEFDAQRTRYVRREFSDLVLSKGQDQIVNNFESQSGVTRMLMDINGDGIPDRLTRSVEASPSRNEARVELGTGQGFATQHPMTLVFPSFVVSAHEDNRSLGLSGSLKYRSDVLENPLCGGFGGTPVIQYGSIERFGLFDVDGDGLPDAVTEFHYEPAFVRDTSLPPAPVAAGTDPDVATRSRRDPIGDPEAVCRVPGPHRERWPVWKVRYNLGTGFSEQTELVEAPVALPAIGPDMAVGARQRASFVTDQYIFKPTVDSPSQIDIAGISDVNGDGFGPDGFVREYYNTCKADDPRPTCARQAYYDYICTGEGAFEFCLFDRTDRQLLPPGHRKLMLKGPSGGLTALDGAWAFPEPGRTATSVVRETVPQTNTHEISTEVALQDLNGDALPDYLTVAGEGLWMFPNLGSGWRSSPILMQGGLDHSVSHATAVVFEKQGRFPTKGYQSNKRLLLDINHDGLVDQVDLGDGNEIRVNVNRGFGFEAPARTFMLGDNEVLSDLANSLRGFTMMNLMGSDPSLRWRKWGAFVDLTGDGLEDIVAWNHETQKYELYAAEVASSPPHRINAIHNGRGAITGIEYASTADPDVVVQGEHDGEWHAVRKPRWVVKRIKVFPGGAAVPRMTSEYRYRYPVHNRDLYGRGAVRGFKEIVRTAPSGSRTVSRSGFDEHYGGLLSEKTTYTAENPEKPHSIQTFGYTGLPALHDADARMLPDREAYNWHRVDTTSYFCPASVPEEGDARAHCLAQGAKRRESTTWDVLSYLGDGISTEVPALRVAVARETNDDTEGGETEVIKSATQYVQRIDQDEYLVRESSNGINDATPGSPDRGRNLGHKRNVWDSTLRELRFDEVKVFEWNGTANVEVQRQRSDYFYNPDGTLRQVIAPQERSIRTAGPGTEVFYDRVGVTETKRRQTVLAHAGADPSIHVTRTVTDIGTGATLLTAGPNYLCASGATCTAPEPGASPAESSDAILHYTRTEVDGLGRPLAQHVTIAEGEDRYREEKIAEYRYEDKPVSFRNKRGPRVTEDRRAASGMVRTVTHFDGLGREQYMGVLKDGTTGLELPTVYSWDSAGDLTEIEVLDPRATGDSVSTVTYGMTYDSLGRPLETRGPGDVILSRVSYPGPLESVITEPSEAGAPAAAKRLIKDAGDRLVRVEEQLDDDTWAVTRYAYNGAGTMEQVTDPEGLVTRMHHDSAGRRVRVETGGRVWGYAYDVGNNLVAVTSPHDAGDDAAYTKRMTYDSISRLVKTIPAVADLSDDEHTAFAVGPTEHIYDVPVTGDGAGRHLIGRLTATRGPVVDTELEYDALGNVTLSREVLKVPNLGEASGVALTSTAEYHLDGQPKVTALRNQSSGTPLAHAFEYGYDRRGQPTQLHYDGRSLVTLVRYNGGNVRKRIVDTGTADKTDTLYKYDPLGRLATMVVRSADGASIPYSQQYAYYPNQLVKRVWEQGLGDERHVMDFEWDTRHQLRRARQTEGNPGYLAELGYGAAGRLQEAAVSLAVTDPQRLIGTRVNPRQVRYGYEDQDPQRLAELLNPDGSIYAAYTYDEAGNVIGRTLGEEHWDLRYDGENRLRRVDYLAAPDQPVQTETFYYDGAKRVLAVRSDGRVRRWFGDVELRYRDGGEQLDRTLVTARLGQPVARIRDLVEIEHRVQTPQGHEALSMRVNTETGVATVEMGKLYGPFGEVLYGELGTGKEDEDYTEEFNGKHYDRLGGLHYYGYRYYDPVALMWNRADPQYRFAPDADYAEPRRMNLYAFTLNNPVTLVDPDGLDSLKNVKEALTPSQLIGQVIESTGVIEDVRAATKEFGEGLRGFLTGPGKNFIGQQYMRETDLNNVVVLASRTVRSLLKASPYAKPGFAVSSPGYHSMIRAATKYAVAKGKSVLVHKALVKARAKSVAANKRFEARSKEGVTDTETDNNVLLNYSDEGIEAQNARELYESVKEEYRSVSLEVFRARKDLEDVVNSRQSYCDITPGSDDCEGIEVKQDEIAEGIDKRTLNQFP